VDPDEKSGRVGSGYATSMAGVWVRIPTGVPGGSARRPLWTIEAGPATA
jgi:hypothetical protein